MTQDNIRPIHIHPRIKEVMAEIGMSEEEYLAGRGEAFQFPEDDGPDGKWGKSVPQFWAWEKSTTSDSNWYGKLKTENGVARIDMTIAQLGGANFRLSAWDRYWTHSVTGGGTIDQFIRMAEEWANKIIDQKPEPFEPAAGQAAALVEENRQLRLELEAARLDAQNLRAANQALVDQATPGGTINEIVAQNAQYRSTVLSLQQQVHQLSRANYKARKILKKGALHT